MPPSKSQVEKWIQEISVATIVTRWRHICGRHLPGKDGTAPEGKSYFTITGETIATKLSQTVQTRQNRMLADAGDSSRALVLRDFAPEVIGKDGAADCTYCVVVIGAAKAGGNQAAVMTAYPATASFVARKAPLT
jgi:hypothetical protein